MKKRLLSLVLVMCMLLPVIPLTVSAKSGDEFLHAESGMTFKVITEPVGNTPGTLRLINDGTASGACRIPSVVFNAVTSREYTVTEIEESVFYENTAITSVELPGTIAVIPGYCFAACTELQAVTIPSSITDIMANAFCQCTKLASVTFAGNSRLKTIGQRAFTKCEALEAISIPGSVISIGDSAFSYCYGLRFLTFAENSELKTIGSDAFNNCLRAYRDEQNELRHYPLVIPDGVTSIGSNAFYYCEGIDVLTLPESLTTIGDDAFGYFINLVSMNVPKSLTSVSEYAFRSDIPKYTSVTFSAGTYEYYSHETNTYGSYPVAPKCFGGVTRFVFSGGSLNAPAYSMQRLVQSTPTKEYISVYMTTVTLNSASGTARSYAVIDALLDENDEPISYNLTDTYTDHEGKLYLWLPENTKLSAVRVKENAEGTVTTTYKHAGGTLTVDDNNNNAGSFAETVGNLEPITVDIYGNDSIEAVIFPSSREPYGYENGVYSDTNLVTNGVATLSYKLMFRQKHDGEGYSWVRIPDDYTLAGLYLNPEGMPSIPYSVSSDFTKNWSAWGGSLGYGGDTYAFTMPEDGAHIVAMIIKKNGTVPSVSTASLPDGIIDRDYSYTLEATGDTPVEWTADTLPAGLTLNKNTGVISGTPTQPQTVNTTFTVTNSYGSRTKNISLTIGASLAFTDSEAYDIPAASSGTAVTPIDVSGGVSGGIPPYSFSKISGPDWLTVSSDGIIGGTRSGPATSAQEAVVRVTDNMGEYDAITISIADIAAGPLPAATGLTWDGAVIGWNSVTGAGTYSIELYKDGTEAANKISLGLFGSTTAKNSDMTSYIIQNGAGTYYFRVKAKAAMIWGGTASYLDGGWSDFSAGFAAPSVSYSYNKPVAITENGITATVSYNRVSPQFENADVTATVTLSGTAVTAGEIIADFYGVKANTMYNVTRIPVTAGQKMTLQNKFTVTFTVPAENIDDFSLTHIFVPTESRGDITGDGVCDVIDCMMVERIISNNHSPTYYEQLLVDYDTNGDIDIDDYQQTVNAALILQTQ